MPTDRAAVERIFQAASSRLAELPVERCREIELAQVRALRAPRPRPAMLVELLARMRDEPASEAWRERAYATLRRLTARLTAEGVRPETLQTAVNAYVDGQTELAATWFDLDTLLRPWGER